MRVSKIWVQKLFGLFDHIIPLSTEERITIIHGPNGFGKTFILRMVAGLLSGRYSIFQRAPFDAFGVQFNDGRTLEVRPTATDSPQLELPSSQRTRSRKLADSLEIRLLEDGVTLETATIDRVDWTMHREERAEIAHYLERLTPLTRITPSMWRDVRSGERISFVDAIERYQHVFPVSSDAIVHKEPKWLSALRRSIPVRFIQTQRLDTFTREEVRNDEPGARVPTVKSYSKDLTQQLQLALGQYATRSSELDSTFPGRLFALPSSEVLSSESLVERLGELEKRRAHLTTLGFIDPGESLTPPPNALERNRDALSVYVSDVAEKLGVFDDLAAKVDLLKTIVNDRFKYKTLSISRNAGFAFTSDTGSRLSAEDLSSGEQHELVLLYELLIKLQGNSLVLIDEPEISLHILWQQQFLDDLHRMVKVSGFDAIIATHSPQLIGDYWHLSVGLKGPGASADGESGR